MPGNPISTAASRPQAPAPWNPLDQDPPRHHSAAAYQPIPAPSSLAPLADPHAPAPAVPAAFAPGTRSPEPQTIAPAPAPPAPAAAPAPTPAPAPVAAPEPAPAPPEPAPPAPPRVAPVGSIASLLNPAPKPKAEKLIPKVGSGPASAAPAVKSMSEQIAASIAAGRAAKPAPGATKMAAITASGKIAGGVNAPEARATVAEPTDDSKRRLGRRKKARKAPDQAQAAAAMPRPAKAVSVVAPTPSVPLSEVRKQQHTEAKKAGKGAFLLTALLLVGAGVGGQYAVNEGLVTPPWAEPAVAVDDCVQGEQTLGSLAAGEEIDVARVSCDQPGAQPVVAQVDTEDQCPPDVDGVVSTGKNLFCVAVVTTEPDAGQ